MFSPLSEKIEKVPTTVAAMPVPSATAVGCAQMNRENVAHSLGVLRRICVELELFPSYFVHMLHPFRLKTFATAIAGALTLNRAA